MTENSGLPQRKVIVVLKRPGPVDKLITYYKGIFSSMSNDDTYVGSAAKLAIFETDLKDLDLKQSGFKAKPPVFSKAQRNNAVAKCVLSSDALVMDVQTLCNASPATAEAIATGANMHAKIINPRGKQKNDWEFGNESGVVEFTAEGQGPHQWQSSDDGVNWLNDDPTNDSTKVYPNETIGKVRWYRNRQILPKGQYGPWSPATKIIIN